MKIYDRNLGMSKCSSVRSVIERIEGEMPEDRKLRARIEKLISQLSKSQEQTCPL